MSTLLSTVLNEQAKPSDITQCLEAGFSLGNLADECRAELQRVCHWWQDNVLLPEGFAGEVSSAGEVKPAAPKGIILATRLLWFYSEAAIYLGQPQWRKVADHLYRYIATHFIDRHYGGVFWELDAKGCVTNNRKQVYAQAFAIYAFSAYYRLSGDKHVLDLAYSLFGLIERHALDRINGGYCEAFSHDWGRLDDLRLSDKDLNSAKTMNTHLHILEAFTGLYIADKNPDVQNALTGLVRCYSKHFSAETVPHLKMFMDLDWQDDSVDYSYGHDIESSWLLWEAAHALGDEHLRDELKDLVLTLVSSCENEGIQSDGSLIDAYSLVDACQIEDRVWWVQAEALVGFFNAYEMTGDRRYLTIVNKLWSYIKLEIIDSEKGEWRWLAKSDPKSASHYTAGFWKGPYHNGRALIELCQRIEAITQV